ncbi:phage tail assembly chaperone family protein, TAC [Cobetia sp. MC34]|uniref:phage tail assembly chaperone family protein, TAC n=1 Tax=Cobetia sp. MC34 TaxID=2785080 RepID=UPI001BC962C8|nr:phage tail assembly chaperone family protein, TAC [Cobetia sp. MC34]MBS4155241.1 phage tail assembly chaperone family protein, TAC [Cobetia sp. MC34]
MKLSLDSLAAAGAFAPSQLVEKQVEFDNGEEVVEFTVFIKPLSYRTAVSEITASQASKDPLAARIANSICDKSGAPVFSIEDITGESDPERGELSGALTIALLSAITEVSGLGKRKSRLALKKSSGTNLSSTA